MDRNGCRVTPSPPTPVLGLTAAPEIAIALDKVILPFINDGVVDQPVALLPQYAGVKIKLSPPLPRNLAMPDDTNTILLLMMSFLG